MSGDIVEPILTPNPSRFVLFPIQHHDIWGSYKAQESVFWTAEELDLVHDKIDWAKLSDSEKHFIKYVLAFFAGSDGIVQENLATRFQREVQYPEAKFAYSMQNMMEAIHSEVYSLLIDTYIDDKEEKMHLFRAIEEVPVIKKKADWAIKWIENEDAPFAQRLIAFAAVEGIFFSGSFCAIFWLKKRGIMPGLTTSNEFIARDEGQHTDFACLLYRDHIVGKLSEEVVHGIIGSAVEIEKEFICDALPCSLLGMNSKMMSQYIEFVADRLTVQLGYNKIFGATNPFDFMERISLEGKDNFFEKRVSSYAKANVGSSVDHKSITIDEDIDF